MPTSSYQQASALRAPGDTFRAFLAKLDAAGAPYTVEVLRMRGEHPYEREGRVHVSVFVQG